MEVQETRLPGLGLRHDFTLADGRSIGVVSLKNGMRQFVVYDEADPDQVAVSVDLAPEESQVVAELLGAPRVIERLNRLREQVDGLATAGIPIGVDSPFVGRTLGESRLRSRTGASVVAVVRDDRVAPSPTPDYTFHSGDRVIVVGTDEGVQQASDILLAG